MDLTYAALGAGGLGAVAAVVSGGWRKLKEFYETASGVIFSRMEVYGPAHRELIEYLHSEWRRPPRSKRHVCSGQYAVAGMAARTTVPYRVEGVEGFNWRGRRLMTVSVKSVNGDRCVSMTAIRGTVNFEAVVKEAILHRLAGGATTADESRFSVRDVMGEEKNMKGFGQMLKPPEPSSSGGQENPSATGESGPFTWNESELSFQRFGSFMWPTESYRPPPGDAFQGLYLEPEAWRLVDQARRWAKMRMWYMERRIPWRRGWMLHGPGGTGKSSLARAVAEDLGWPLVRYHLSTMTDQEFLGFWRDLPTPCVVLFEDIDGIWHGRDPASDRVLLGFDTFINALSGVDSQDGVLAIGTTNVLDNIDPALGRGDGISTRPGRFDTVVRLGEISEANRRRMAESTLRDWPELVDESVAGGNGSTPAQFQEFLIQKAMTMLSVEGGSLAAETDTPKATTRGETNVADLPEPAEPDTGVV